MYSDVVLFGGAGFIGSHLVKHYLDAGLRVCVADVRRSKLSHENLRFNYCDVREPIELQFGGAAPVHVLNLAAVHRTPGHKPEEYYDTNVAGALNIADWCERSGVTQLTFTSSISVYGSTEQPKTEDSRLEPNSPYGKSKRLAEQIHQKWQSHGPGRQLRIVRPGVVFGPGENGNFTRLAHALSRRTFAYPGRKDVVKACGYVGDLVRAIDFVNRRPEETLKTNFCYPKRYTIEEICQAFSLVAGFHEPKMIPPQAMSFVRGVLRRLPTAPDAALHVDRVSKLTASTNIVPKALIDLGFKWSGGVVEGVDAWRAAEPLNQFI